MNTEVEELECTENSGLRTITCTGERCSKVSILEPLPGTVTLTGTITLLQLPWLLPSSSLRPPRRSRRRPEVTPTLPSRPQPARSPYEWMKRPSLSARPCKEGPEGRTRTKDKYRVVYSDHQRLELEKEFHYSRYITIRRKAEL